MTYIIIPTYNHLEDALKPCVESILKYTTLSENTRLLIVANGCTDDTQCYLAQVKERTRFLEDIWYEKPLGYTASCNRGFEYALDRNAEYVVLLNNDTVVLPSSLDKWILALLIPMFKDPKVSITGTHPQYSRITKREFLLTYCVGMRMSVMKEIGTFDELFSPGGNEDTDYCYRAEQAGYKLGVVERPKYDESSKTMVGDYPLYHRASTSLAEIPGWDNIFKRSEILLAMKHGLKHE